MDKEKRFNWLMFLFVLPFALLGGIILLIGARDNERHKKAVYLHEYHQQESNLKTLEDSIHFYEDGM